MMQISDTTIQFKDILETVNKSTSSYVIKFVAINHHSIFSISETINKSTLSCYQIFDV